MLVPLEVHNIYCLPIHISWVHTDIDDADDAVRGRRQIDALGGRSFGGGGGGVIDARSMRGVAASRGDACGANDGHQDHDDDDDEPKAVSAEIVPKPSSSNIVSSLKAKLGKF